MAEKTTTPSGTKNSLTPKSIEIAERASFVAYKNGRHLPSLYMNPPTPSTSNQMPPTMAPKEMMIEQIPGAALSLKSAPKRNPIAENISAEGITAATVKASPAMFREYPTTIDTTIAAASDTHTWITAVRSIGRIYPHTKSPLFMGEE